MIICPIGRVAAIALQGRHGYEQSEARDAMNEGRCDKGEQGHRRMRAPALAMLLAAAFAAPPSHAQTTVTSADQDKTTTLHLQERAERMMPRDRLRAVLRALTGSLQQDGLMVGALSYELSPEAARSVEDELTATALARLKERGARIAQALNLTVERLRDLRVGNANGTQPIPRAMSAMKSDVAMPAPVAEPGEAEVSVMVDADLVLVPSR